MSTGDTDPEAAAHTGSGAARGGWLRWVGVAGLCLAIWGGLVLVWPYWEKHRAYEIVAEHFEWDEKEKAATLREESTGAGIGALRELDRRTARALRVVGTRRLAIYECPRLMNVEVLGDIGTLQHLSLRGCTGLSSVAGLPADVQELDVWECPGLTIVAGLPEGLQSLHLSNCQGLKSVAGLSAGLQSLLLFGCPGLTRVAHLPAGLQYLHLGDCPGLTSVAGLPAGLQMLYLDGCKGITEVGSLPQGLKTVFLEATPKLPEAVKAEIRALVKKNGGEVVER